MDCLFCKIIEGDIDSLTLYEDNAVKVIMDIKPNSNGHILIIPNRHIEDFMEIDATTVSHVYKVAKELKEYLYAALKPDGLILRVNYGNVQEIKHFHLHVIPVYEKEQPIYDVDAVYDKISKQINLFNLMN